MIGVHIIVKIIFSLDRIFSKAMNAYTVISGAFERQAFVHNPYAHFVWNFVNEIIALFCSKSVTLVKLCS